MSVNIIVINTLRSFYYDKEAVVEQVESAPEMEAPAQEDTSISLNDLQVLANIVDLASQRGAFRGNELTQVGAVFDKLSAFLAQVAAAQAEQAEGRRCTRRRNRGGLIMADIVKHVGQYGQKKCVVVFREVPNETDQCLIVMSDTLEGRMHDELMDVYYWARSTECQGPSRRIEP